MSRNLAPNPIYEDEKNRIIPIVAKQLVTDRLLDLTGWVDDNCESPTYTHPGFVRSVAYRMEALRIAEVIPVQEWNRFYIKDKSWDYKHPYKYYFTLALIGLLFSLIAGISSSITTELIKQKYFHKTEQQMETISKQDLSPTNKQPHQFYKKSDTSKVLVK